MNFEKRLENLLDWLNDPKSACNYDTLLDILCSLVYDHTFAAKQNGDQNSQFLDRYENIVDKVQELRTNIKDFTRIKLLKLGYFGEVNLVRHKSSNAKMTMTILDKTLVKKQYLNSQRIEKEILRNIDSDWIVKLYCIFLDSQYLYMCTEYLSGGSLADWLADKDFIPEGEAAFYLAEMTLCLEVLHSFGYAHCDLRPEKFIFDSKGHLKLTDFLESTRIGTYKQINYDDDVGLKWLLHPNYCCPELLSDQDGIVQVNCDWWSVGVIFFEMIFGEPPFSAQEDCNIFDCIVNFHSSLKFSPTINVSDETKNLILAFLSDSQDRIGSGGAKEIKVHPFFLKFRKEWNWDQIRNSIAPRTPLLYNEFKESKSSSRRSNSFERFSLRHFALENLAYVGFTYDALQGKSMSKEISIRNVARSSSTVVKESETILNHLDRLESVTTLVELEKQELSAKYEKQQETIELLRKQVFIKERRINDLGKSLEKERQKKSLPHLIINEDTFPDEFMTLSERNRLDSQTSCAFHENRLRSRSDLSNESNMRGLATYLKELSSERFQLEDKCELLKTELESTQATLELTQEKFKAQQSKLQKREIEIKHLKKNEELRTAFFEQHKRRFKEKNQNLIEQLEEVKSKCSHQGSIIEKLQDEVKSLNKEILSLRHTIYVGMCQKSPNFQDDSKVRSQPSHATSHYLHRLETKLEHVRAQSSNDENKSLLKHLSNLRRDLMKERQLRMMAEEDLKQGEAWIDHLIRGKHRQYNQNKINNVKSEDSDNELKVDIWLQEWDKNQESKIWTQRFAQLDGDSFKIYVSQEAYQNKATASLEIPLSKIIHIRNANKHSLNVFVCELELTNILQIIYDITDLSPTITTDYHLGSSNTLQWQGHQFQRVYLRLIPVLCQVCHRTCTELFDPPESFQCSKCHMIVHANHVKNQERFPACTHAVCSQLIRFSSEEEKALCMEFIHLKKHRLSPGESHRIKSISSCGCNTDFSDYDFL